MYLKTFKGGIHPGDRKELTNTVPISDCPPPKEVIIPLRQHIGAPCEPCVNVGDRVLMGQKIGEATSFVSAPVHASVSGTVTKIENYPHPGGGEALSVFIENDEKDELFPEIKEWDLDLSKDSIKAFVEKQDAKEIVEKVKNAGITGMGGAAFPTHVKLSPPADVKIHTIIINGAECEPYLTTDHREMLENTKKIILGALLVAKSVSAEKIVIAIENNKKDAISLLEQETKEFDNIEIFTMLTKYPQGSEKQLINAVTKSEVPSGALPSAVGVVVNNIDTCAAISEAVVTNRPLYERVVTVSGDAVNNPKNLRVRVGVKFSELLEIAGGFKEEPKKIVMGGPMMGIAQNNIEVPVIKGTSGILAFSAPETYGKDEGACIKCGKCVEVCPMRLMPNFLSTASVAKDVEKIKAHNILDCMECGCCSFICPQRRFIVQHIKAGKALLKQKG
ncbi:MAG: electron transport complex subunit RsxC [Clostridia bacterium]|nr:electron transport complex subunit RsxC [Clostridia bacterium]